MTLSWCYVLPLHIIQVYPAVCVSSVLWHHLNRSSALSDICFAALAYNPVHAQGIPIWSVLGRPQQLSCFSFWDTNCTDTEVYQEWPRCEGPWNISDPMSVQPSVCQTEWKWYCGEMHRIHEKWLDEPQEWVVTEHSIKTDHTEFIGTKILHRTSGSMDHLVREQLWWDWTLVTLRQTVVSN